MPRMWRVHEPALDPAPGRLIPLGRAEAHHLKKVLRLAPGELVALFDGRGVEWCGELVVVDTGLAVRLVSALENPVEPERIVRLFQGLCRPDRFEWVVQKGTELGVASVHPWVSDRVNVHPPKSARLDRWRRIAAEACKQSGRRTVPRIESVEALPQVPDGNIGILLDPEAEESFATGLAPRETAEIWLAIGPESGLDPLERRAATDAGWLGRGMGPRVLRSETAGIVAVAFALHLWGDLAAL